jgi:hypothetical protein
MKKPILTLASVLFCAITFAQSVPQGINYQAVARDASGTILTNHIMSLKASVYSDTVANTLQWQEVHSVTTNDVGIFTIVIGDGLGLPTSFQSNFSDINWNASSHYIKIELDHGSGFMDYGTTALQSVPYALAAETADEANAVDWTNINNIPADIADGDDVDDADNSVTNELQTITLSGDTLYISSGNNVDLSGYNAGVFATDSNVTSNANGDYANDDFVFGSPTLNWNSNNDNANRMFFDKSNGAFRAGTCTNMNWNTDSLGNRSFASGYNTKATGWHSTAMGHETNATGYISTSMGFSTDATGNYSTAMGFNTAATGEYSTAMGYSTNATGTSSTAIGYKTDATGTESTAMGRFTEATGTYSTAMGYYTEAYYNQLACGRNNIVSGNAASYNSAATLFVVGNGTAVINKSNALNLTGQGNLTISGTLSQSSDIRLKTNITPMGNVLAALQFINPISYEFKDTETHPAGLQIGFSAQEIQTQFPELVRENAKGELTVAYGQMSAVLLQAVKEQQEMINTQQKLIEQLQIDVNELKNQ